MTTPKFAFVPRAVSKYTKPWEGISRSSPSRSPSPDTTSDVDQDEPSSDEANGTTEQAQRSKQSSTATAQDIASLVSLALSDYNIWHDGDLRWKLDACLADDTPDSAGFVPINYLLRRPPFRGSLPLVNGQPEPPETEVVKALRAHASDLEVRMRLRTSSSVWCGAGKTSRKKDAGGYEVRRRDWQSLSSRPSRGWSRARWDDLTVYMECIPPPYRSVGGIVRFAHAILSATDQTTSTAPCLRVQCVTLPPHYLDKPGDAPKCKGYALVTFLTKADTEAVLHAWPWKRRTVPVSTSQHEHDGGDGEERGAPVSKEAHKFGFRAITKARWDALNEEYLLYKQRIVDAMGRTQTETHPQPGEDMIGPAQTSDRDARTDSPVQTTLSSPYPSGCLVFVRQVHPETNKTTLKSLFAQAFQDGSAPQAQGHLATGIDYVDYTKGMDTCHLRLASPRHAAELITYFDDRCKAQMHGLDAAGTAPLANGAPKRITTERIWGKKEELYWDKVPENIRRQAVIKVVKAQADSAGFHESRHKKRPREF